MNWNLTISIEKRVTVLLAGDLVINVFAFLFCAFIISSLHNNIFVLRVEFLKVKIIVFIIFVLFNSFFLDLYSVTRVFDRKLLFERSFLAALVSFLTLSIFYYFVPYMALENKMLIITLFVFFISQSLWHNLYYILMKIPCFTRKTLILGTGSKAEKTRNLLVGNTNQQFHFNGFVGTSNDPVVVPINEIVGNADSLISIVERDNINTIIMALTEQRGNNIIDKLITCRLLGINVIDQPSFYERLTGKLPVEDINPSWLVSAHGLKITIFKRVSKRISDLVLAMLGIIIFLPLFPVIALLIKLSSEGPVFYKQLRTGKMEKRFFIYKFRTMFQYAEDDTGTVWATKQDPRATTIGRFLRKTRLDESPQFFNVLIGDMSFIGPRPERPEFVEQLSGISPFYKDRHFVKPGITGWAQIRYSYGATYGDSIEKLRYDLYYIKNMSPFLDLLIIFETCKVLLFRRGGR
jgi:sugar transferase (PEP-CTERM system associated)